MNFYTEGPDLLLRWMDRGGRKMEGRMEMEEMEGPTEFKKSVRLKEEAKEIPVRVVSKQKNLRKSKIEISKQL